MKKLCLVSLLFLYLMITANCQTRNDSNRKKTILPEVSFFAQEPIVDGILDDNLSWVPARKFDHQLNINLFKGSSNARYRIGYGTGFLYLYIEAESDSILCLDRGYQNGDGFVLVVAKPDPSNRKAKEFYVLGFSPQVKADQMWATKVEWYCNMDLTFRTLDKDVKFAWKGKEGKIGFELLIPWEKLYPYHPWISDGIGFNLSFAKAFPGKSMPNIQQVVSDFHIGAEQSLRKYELLRFARPTVDGSQMYLELDRNHCVRGDTLALKVASVCSNNPIVEFDIQMVNAEKKVVFEEKYRINAGTKNLASEIKFVTADFPAGDYVINWKPSNNAVTRTINLTIMQEFNITKALSELENPGSKMSPGSLLTIRFNLLDIQKRYSRLYPYQTCSRLSQDITETLRNIKETQNGNDIYATKTGIFRRSFNSRIDNTLQPYTVCIPANFNPGKKYPLIVYLHGSGRDDKDLSGFTDIISKDNFIQIAPRARGTSNYYGTLDAQIDIQEAIDDIIKNYPIDSTKIVLAGFSMGGYGVYRTYYENPDRFKALAVFSGTPKIGFTKKSKGGKYMDFLKIRSIKKFDGIPIFIFHGSSDRNTPFGLTEKLVENLRSVGTQVKFMVNEEGHSIPKNQEQLSMYYQWLEDVIK